MPTVEVLRLGFPSADEDTVVGQGRDVETRERISFLVPPDQRLRVLAEAHAGRHSVLTLPLVGRKHELELLADALDGLADERSCRMVTVLGSAGVGKSRLVEEFLASGIGTDLVLRGRCLPYGQGITFWPISEIVRQASGMGERESID